MEHTANYFVDTLQMLPHPEGGFYKETYRSSMLIDKEALPQNFSGNRNISTAIYFLLQGHHFSAFHRIKSDELWHFYYGQPLHVYVIEPNGNYYLIKLGNNPAAGQLFQAVVPAGSWFASRPAHFGQPNVFSLVGCTVAPGFDFADFEMAKAAELSAIYPQHSAIINELCRD